MTQDECLAPDEGYSESLTVVDRVDCQSENVGQQDRSRKWREIVASLGLTLLVVTVFGWIFAMALLLMMAGANDQ